jgi:hypothetical protein
MSRGPSFVVGVVVGGLAGFAAGYLLSRDGQADSSGSIGSIDLTPAIELKNHAPVAKAAEQAEEPA